MGQRLRRMLMVALFAVTACFAGVVTAAPAQAANNYHCSNFVAKTHKGIPYIWQYQCYTKYTKAEKKRGHRNMWRYRVRYLDNGYSGWSRSATYIRA